jgi:hypothetical protein
LICAILEINGDLASLLYTQKEKAVNVIEFSARALKILSGKLTIEASYSVTSQTVRLLFLVFPPGLA